MNKMKKQIAFVCLLGIINFSYSQNEWLKLGDSKEARFSKIKVSEQENLFLTGVYKDSLRFDNNLITGESSSFYPSFLSLFDKEGKNKWLRTLSRNIPQFTVTPKQDVFVSAFVDPIYDKFDTVRLIGNVNQFSFYVTKIDSNGTRLWFNQIKVEDNVTETFDNDVSSYCTKITHDANGDCFVLFKLANAVRFYKLDGRNGNILSKKIYGSINGVTQYSKALDYITCDKAGNLYLMSNFKGSIILPDTTISSQDNTTEQFYIAKYNPQGQRLWFYQKEGYCNNFKVAGSQKFIYFDGFIKGDFKLKTPIDISGRTIYKLDIQSPQVKWVHSYNAYGGYGYAPDVSRKTGDFETDKEDNIYAPVVLNGRFVVDSVAVSIQSSNYGITKIDSSGNLKPIVTYGTINGGFICVAPIGNRVYSGIGLYSYKTQITLSDTIIKMDNGNREKPAIISIDYPTQPYLLQIDSIKSSGTCYDNPLTFYTKSSKYRQGNIFTYDLSIVPEVISSDNQIFGRFPTFRFNDNNFEADKRIESIKIDSFTKPFRYNAERNSFHNFPHPSDEFRVCSLNPFKCSNAYKMDVPTLAFKKDTICRGDTIRLQINGAVSHVWTPNSNILNSKSSSPSVSPQISTKYQAESLSKHNCSIKNEVDVLVIYGTTDSLRDSIKYLCNSPIEAVRLNGTLKPINGSNVLSYKWTPNTYLSDSLSPITFANPISKTKYILSIRDSIYQCTLRDTVIIDVEKCKFIYGTTRPENDVVLANRNGISPDLTIIKAKKADKNGNYSFRTSEKEVYLQTITPNNLQNQIGFKFLPTYFDKSLVAQNAKITKLISDSTKVDITPIKTTDLTSIYRVSGSIFDYYEPTKAIKNLDLLLIDTNYSKILRGQPFDSVATFFTKTDQNGSFTFSNIYSKRTYSFWGNRFSINTANSPTIAVNNANILN
jgi:hypothetical protein